MPFVPLQFKPGINRENTSYGTEGGWYTCDKIRFRNGQPESIGGWAKYSGTSFLGICRALHAWVALDSSNWLAVGTHTKYYVERGNAYNDITPIRRTVTLGVNPFATTNGSATVVVTDVAHGAVNGDYVTFSGATTFNGIPAAEFNVEKQITYLTVDTYTIATTTTANATSSGGGAAVVGTYQINSGQSTQTYGDGWGSSTWGRGTWGSASNVFIPTGQLRQWTQCNFGEDLLFNTRNSAIYYWKTSLGPTVRAVNLTTITGASNVPTVASGIAFSEDRRLVAFGTNPIGSAIQDPLFIRWASQESLSDWTPTATNTAGGYRLTVGNYIQSYLPMKQEILVWTDGALYSMQSSGAPYIFTFQLLTRNISIAGANAMAMAGDVCYWMGQDKFYMYNGRVQTLPCDLWSYIFRDINLDQIQQVYASTNEGFNEIIWLYNSASSTTYPDRYVIYNYVQQIWYYGTISRTAWLDSSLKQYPIAADPNGYLYVHDFGIDDGSTNPGTAINSYIESSDMDMGNGDQVMFVRRIIPDVTFTGSTATSPAATITIKARMFPGSSFPNSKNMTVTRTASVPVETFTTQAWIRLRGRQMVFRVESNATGVRWELGKPRVETQLDGKR